MILGAAKGNSALLTDAPHWNDTALHWPKREPLISAQRVFLQPRKKWACSRQEAYHLLFNQVSRVIAPDCPSAELP
jgi:hypothetical protein